MNCLNRVSTSITLLVCLMSFPGAPAVCQAAGAMSAPSGADVCEPSMDPPEAPVGYEYVGVREFEGQLYWVYVNANGEFRLIPIPSEAV